MGFKSDHMLMCFYFPLNMTNPVTAFLYAITPLKFGGVPSMPVLKVILITSGTFFPDAASVTDQTSSTDSSAKCRLEKP